MKFLYFSSRKIVSLNAEVVLATSTPLTIGIPALVKKMVDRTPFIFEVRDVWPEAVIAMGAIKNRLLQKLLYRLEYVIYKNASAIIPLSSGMKESITTRYPQFLKKPISVIENIAEINRFQNYNKNRFLVKNAIGFDPRFAILYAGTFGKVNGLEYLISLAKRTLAIDPTIIYILMGDGGEKGRIIDLAQRSEVLNKNVFILNPVAKQELNQWYSEVSMGSSFVINKKELWANSANKYFDTLAASKPILINYHGWQAETIEARNIGFVLPVELNDHAVEGFVNYTKDYNLNGVQRTNALKIANELYSLDVAVQKYCVIFDHMKDV